MVISWWRGTRLQRLRRQRGLTQAALARKINGHVMTISRLERGANTPSIRLLQRLAKALDVPVARLVE
jgi:transcriptional regulator with XRE-family HTH domain